MSRATTQAFIEIVGIEDGIVSLRDGTSLLIVETSAVNFQLLSEVEKKASTQAFSALLNSLSFPIQIVVRSQKKDLSPYIALLQWEIIKQRNLTLRAQMERYRDFIKSITQDSILEKNFYITIPLYKSPPFEEVKKALLPRRDHILTQLRRLGLKGRVLTTSEVLKLFHTIFNAQTPFGSETADVRNLIAPALVEVDFSFIKISNRYFKTLIVLDYPRFVSSDWLSPLISFDHTLDIAFFCYPKEGGDVLSDLKRKIAEMEATLSSDIELGRVEDPKLRATLEDAFLLQEELVKGTERFFQFGFYITIPAEGKEELERVTKLVQSTLASLLIVAKPATLQMEDGFKTTIPLGIDRLLITRNMDTTSVASTFPFASSMLSANEGILYGVNKHNDSLVIFDRFTLENANTVVLGKSGGGKSYLIKLESLRSLMFGTEVIIIDPESEYEVLAKELGGEYIPFSFTTPIRLNPFDLSIVSTEDEERNELGSKIISLHGLMNVVLGELTPQEKAVLDRAFMLTYAQKGITQNPITQRNRPPIMEDLFNVLLSMTEPEAKGLSARLERFVRGSLAGIFNQRSNTEIRSAFTVFSLRDLDEAVRPIAMHIVLDFIWTRIRKDVRKRILVIDEAWYLMKYPDSADFIHSIAKRARKYMLGLTTITQDVEDFLSIDKGKAILSNSSIQVLLKQSTASIDLIAKTFYLSEGEKHFLLTSEVGEGVFFAGQNHVAIKVISAPFEHEIIMAERPTSQPTPAPAPAFSQPPTVVAKV